MKSSKIEKYLIRLHIYRLFFKLTNFKNFLAVFFNSKQETKVRLKNGTDLIIRNGVIDDLSVAGYVFVDEYHIPPFEISKNPVIVDLGSNIGCTIIDYSLKYPGARIIGFEMDMSNFSLCQRNIAPFKNAIVYNKAIWFENGHVRYDASTNNDAFSAITLGENNVTKDYKEIESITIATLLEQNSLQKVNFMKIDIEGAELEIFEKGDLDWLNSVDSLHIEIHNEKRIKSISNALEKFNFEIIPDSKHWSALFAKKRNL